MNSIPPRPTQCHIDLDALTFNLHSIRNFIGEGIKIMAVVKANAYGHGAAECSKRLEAEGVDWFGVATLEEAVELRNAGIQNPILCFGGSWPGQEQAFVSHDVTPVIFDLERAAAFDMVASATGQILSVHIKIDTGMGRVGIPFRDLADWIDEFKRFKNLKVEGLMTHFAAADELADDFTNEQMRRFADVVKIFHENGFRPTVLDMANSPGAVGHSDAHATLVRIGGMLYGLGDDVLPKGIDHPELKPVMSLTTEIAFLKTLRKGESVGYGRTFVATRDSVIATLPIGYHDGLKRVLSNKGRVLVNGQIAPVVGRISMDWTTIDVTDIDGIKVGNTVTIIGSDRDQQITAASIAAECDTISYEITCGMGERVPRVFV